MATCALKVFAWAVAAAVPVRQNVALPGRTAVLAAVEVVVVTVSWGSTATTTTCARVIRVVP
jgi:hypothetical protein